MTWRGAFLMASGFVFLAILITVRPAWAQSEDIEAQIKALEAEVQKIEPLKEQIERLRYQQLEMKKEATAAAAAMPDFRYRPGRGLTIAAADKSWSFNTSYRVHMYIYNILGGKTNFNDNGTQRNTGVTAGEIFPRRNRMYFNYCWQDCFYAFEFSFDGEESPRTAQVRDNEFIVNFNQLNPWLPYFSIGLRRGPGRTHIGRSGDNDGKMEHSLILDGFAWSGTGSHAGMGLGWDGVDIGPGEYDLFLNFATSRQGTHQEFVNDDRKGFLMYIGGKPFSKMKNKWISGLELGLGYQGQSHERPDNLAAGEGEQIRVRNAERRGRQVLFQPAVAAGVVSDQNFGSGYNQVFIPGMKWVLGPYMFRAVYVTTRYANERSTGGNGLWGRGFTLDNQIFLWSPKGFMTGSTNMPNSLMLSFGFERADMDCGRNCDASPSTGSFHSQTVLNRETALWYWLRPGLGVGMWWHYWTTSNTPYRTQVANGCKDSRTEALAGKGVSRSCDWHSLNTGLRYRW